MEKKAFSVLSPHWHFEIVIKVYFHMPKTNVDFTNVIFRVIIKIYFNLNKNKFYRLLSSAHSFTFSKKKNPADSIIVIETEKSTHSGANYAGLRIGSSTSIYRPLEINYLAKI